MIEVKHLTKRYGTHTAVSDLSFTIERGQIYGFLGPNGAGKSTTMNIMTGCLAASAGEVKIGGFDIFEEPTQAKRLNTDIFVRSAKYVIASCEELKAFDTITKAGGRIG